MALKPFLQSVDDLPEDLKAHYVERDGKFALDVDPLEGWALEDVAGLKSSLSKEREAVKEAAAKLKAFDDIDAEAAREALKKVEEMANWNPDKQVAEQVKSFEEQLQKKHKRELDGKDTELKKTVTQLENILVKEAISRAAAKFKAEPELLQAYGRDFIKMRQDENGYYPVVLDREGVTRISPKGASTDRMSVDEWAEELRDTPVGARMFDGSGSSGSGATGGGGTGGPKKSSEVKWGDLDGMAASLDDIASGKVTVVD